MYRPQRNYGCRMHTNLAYFGMETVVLENERLRISVLAGKGTDIYEFLYKPADMDFMWLSERGVSNPAAYLPTSPDPASTFLDYYAGGWQEVFPNGGPTSNSLGAVFGQHGEVAHMPWSYSIEVDNAEAVQVAFTVRPRKLPVELRKTLRLESGQAKLYIREEIHNLSQVELPYMWGHHIALGKPFLVPGCTIRVPDGVEAVTEPVESDVCSPGRIRRGKRHAWPVAEGIGGEPVDLSLLPPPGTPSDIVYLANFPAEAWYEVDNPQAGLGWRVQWDAAAMPYLWYWQEYGATQGYPWYGRHYNVGLEPFCGFPTAGLEEAVGNGSAGKLPPGGKAVFAMQASVYEL